jgi:DNA-directed RNA polymerase specialized sigma24 family protein
MVMVVCLAALSNRDDAKDAFQATFVILIRKAGSLWVNDSLGGWLHGVATRVARQVR